MTLAEEFFDKNCNARLKILGTGYGVIGTLVGCGDENSGGILFLNNAECIPGVYMPQSYSYLEYARIYKLKVNSKMKSEDLLFAFRYPDTVKSIELVSKSFSKERQYIKQLMLKVSTK